MWGRTDCAIPRYVCLAEGGPKSGAREARHIPNHSRSVRKWESRGRKSEQLILRGRTPSRAHSTSFLHIAFQ